MPTPPAESPREWDCRTPSGDLCLGMPEVLPQHPEIEESEVPGHLPGCRLDFLSVLACSRRRCFTAREALTSVFHDTVMARVASIGIACGIFGQDRHDLAMDALTDLLGKVQRLDSWAPDYRDDAWHLNRDQGKGESFAPLISAVTSNALKQALVPYLDHRRFSASLYKTDEDGEAYFAHEEDASSERLGDPQEFVVDDLQFTLVSENGQAAVLRFVRDLHAWLADYPDDVQEMIWLYLRHWGDGGSRRAAAVAIFGETPSGVPVNATRNNKILAALEEYLRDGLADLEKDETTRPVALLLAHALRLDIDAETSTDFSETDPRPTRR